MSTARRLCIALKLSSGAASMLVSASAAAADVGVVVSMSPDSARVIRDWRRAHGLDQVPEQSEAQSRIDVALVVTYPGFANAGGYVAVVSRPVGRLQPATNAWGAVGDVRQQP